MPFIIPFMDPAQLGGRKGCAITHYLIQLFHFIYSTGDLPNNTPHSVILALVDWSKGFNRLDHNLLVTLLSDYNVPGWLLRIIISYLTERRLVVRHKGYSSTEQAMPGGSPQGTLLGVLFFLVMVNQAGWPKQQLQQQQTCTSTDLSLNRPVPQQIPEINGDSGIRLKWIDDLTQGVRLNLKQALCSDFNRWPTRDYHERFGLVLPPQNNPLQEQIDQLSEFTDSHLMKLNKKKTKIFPFNFSKTRDFIPAVSIPGESEPLEVVYQTKLLGVICTSDSKWAENTSYIVKKAASKLWMVRRLKWMGADEHILHEMYILHIRTVLEFAAPLWHSSLTVSDQNRIERVQKMAFSIILGPAYTNYDVALTLLEEETLLNRRKQLCLNFASKSSKDPQHSHMFPATNPNRPVTRNRKKFHETKCRTMRLYKSAIPYLIRLLNEQ